MDRKSMIRDYKDTPRPAGVYRVRNSSSGRSLVGSSPDLPAMFNRIQFQLKMGSYPDQELQKDWNDFGPDAFSFEILDRLEPSSDPGCDTAEDLRVLRQMWLEKLAASGVLFYPMSRRGL